ncbi:MAG: AAA family ATPase [Desulfuromusa sp.]|nr:AAA family ATPase [Desulfuromusa sp.]
MKDKQRNRLVQRMLDPTFYDHPVTRIELVETHISWIFLAGEFAYKLKKPVNFGFLDFSTLEKRRYFCQEELRINKRFAPQLYLEVVQIGGKQDRPKLNGKPALDYVVKMKRFPQQKQLDRMLAAGQLTNNHIEKFALKIARIHRDAPIAGIHSHFGSPQAIIDPILQNFIQLRRFLPDPAMLRQVDRLEEWSRDTYTRLEPIFLQRKSAGFIRECHGDIHLANMAWLDGAPLLFDCIEFNENLRWVDPISDIAFLAMDLDDRRESALGWRFLNYYLLESGDYPGMALLNFYKVYRAMVRVKVTCLRLSQSDFSEAERNADLELLQSYLELATSYMTPKASLLIITHGLSGSGKSSFVNQLAPLCNGICLHSDLERKRLYQLAPTENSHSQIAAGIYSTAASIKTYSRLRELADILLKAGILTLVDATFIKQSSREQMRQLALKQQIPLVILDFPLAEKELRQRIKQRIKQRTRQTGQFSEATEEVLDNQLAYEEPLIATERNHVIGINPKTEVEQIAGQLKKLSSGYAPPSS